MSPRTQKEIKLDSLVAQLHLFEVLQANHVVWASKINDLEIERVHRELIGLIQQTRQKYEILLEKYHSNLEEGMTKKHL